VKDAKRQLTRDEAELKKLAAGREGLATLSP
jgi:hypothetical protein